MGNNTIPEQEASKTMNEGQKINKCSLKFLQPKEKDVELVREDGSVEIINLVK